MRPYARASGGSNESTVAAAPAARCASTSERSSSDVIAGTSPFSTSTSPLRVGERRARGAHRVSGAERFRLHGDLEPVEEPGGVG